MAGLCRARGTSPATLVGAYALANAITSPPLLIFSYLNLRAIQSTDVRRHHTLVQYVKVRVLTTVIALIITAMSAVLTATDTQAALVLLFVAVTKSAEAISDILNGALQQMERMDRVAVSMAATGLLGLLAAGIFLEFHARPIFAIAAIALARVAVLVFYDIPIGVAFTHAYAARSAKLGRRSASFRDLSHLAWTAAPLGLVMMLSTINSEVPKYFLGKFTGLTEVAVFAAFVYLLQAGNMVATAMAQSAAPRLAGIYAAGDFAKFKRLLVQLIVIGSLVGAVAICVVAIGGTDLIALLYPYEYARHISVLLWIMVAATLIYGGSFFGVALTAMHRYQQQVRLQFVVLGLAVLACALFVPKWGLAGAAGSLAFAISAFRVGVYAHAVVQGMRASVRTGNETRQQMEETREIA